MASGATFSDILDDQLRDAAGQPPQGPRFSEARRMPPHPLLFATAERPFRRAAYSPAHDSAGAAPRRPAVAPPARPRRMLTARQRQALDAFTRHGVRLNDDFTAGELRTAFRSLALAYHPDRHPGSSEREQAQWTRVLADLNEHHRQLMTACRQAA